MDIGKLIASLGLDNREFLQGIREAESRMQTSSAQMERSLTQVGDRMEQVGKKMQSVGKKMSMALTLPLTALGGMMAKTAASFEKSMNQVAAVSGATGAELQSLEDIARRMGATTKFTADEAAGALNFLAMAGFSVVESLAALPPTLKLASAGAMDLAESADIVSNVMQGFGLDASLTAETVDIMTKAFTSSNTSLSQLGEAMSYAAPISKAFGQDIRMATAAVGFLSDAGIQGTRAGTGLSQSLLQLSRHAHTVGLDVLDAAGNMLPLADILEKVEEQGISSMTMIQTLGARAGPAFATLMGRGSKALREFTAELDDSGGTAESVSNIQMQGLIGAVTKLKSAWTELSISFMSSFLPVLTGWAENLKSVVDRLAQLNDNTKNAIVIIGALLAVVGPLLLIFGKILAMYGAMLKAIAANIAIVKALTAAKIGLTKAMAVLNAAYLASPMGVFIITAAALTAGLYALQRSKSNLNQTQQSLNRIQKETIKQYHDEAVQISRLRTLVEDSNVPLERRQQAIENLNKVVPAYNAHLSTEGTLYRNNTRALDIYLESVKEKIRLNVMEDEMTKILTNQLKIEQQILDRREEIARLQREIAELDDDPRRSKGTGRQFKIELIELEELAIERLTRRLSQADEAYVKLGQIFADVASRSEKLEFKSIQFNVEDNIQSVKVFEDAIVRLNNVKVEDFSEHIKTELGGALSFMKDAVKDIDELDVSGFRKILEQELVSSVTVLESSFKNLDSTRLLGLQKYLEDELVRAVNQTTVSVGLMSHEMVAGFARLHDEIVETENTLNEFRIEAIRKSLELIDNKLNQTGQTTKVVRRHVEDLQDTFNEQWGVGIFDDITQEFNELDQMYTNLDKAFKFIEIKATVSDDFDELQAKIIATERVVTDMIDSIVEGEMDPRFLDDFVIKLNELNELAKQREVEQMFSRIGEQIKSLDSYSEFVTAIGSEFDFARERVRLLENQLEVLWSSSEKGTDQWQETWDDLLGQLERARIELEMDEIVIRARIQLDGLENLLGGEDSLLSDLFSGLLDEAKEIMSKIEEEFDKGAEASVEYIAELSEQLIDLLKGAELQVQAVVQVVYLVGDTAGDVLDEIGAGLTGAETDFKQYVGSFLNGLSQIINRLLAQAIASMIANESSKGLLGLATAAVGVGALKAMWASNVPEMAQGGVIPPGYDGDKYAAFLNTGEIIVPPKKLEIFLDNLTQDIIQKVTSPDQSGIQTITQEINVANTSESLTKDIITILTNLERYQASADTHLSDFRGVSEQINEKLSTNITHSEKTTENVLKSFSVFSNLNEQFLGSEKTNSEMVSKMENIHQSIKVGNDFSRELVSSVFESEINTSFEQIQVITSQFSNSENIQEKSQFNNFAKIATEAFSEIKELTVIQTTEIKELRTSIANAMIVSVPTTNVEYGQAAYPMSSQSQDYSTDIHVHGKLAGEDLFISSARFEQRRRLIE